MLCCPFFAVLLSRRCFGCGIECGDTFNLSLSLWQKKHNQGKGSVDFLVYHLDKSCDISNKNCILYSAMNKKDIPKQDLDSTTCLGEIADQPPRLAEQGIWTFLKYDYAGAWTDLNYNNILMIYGFNFFPGVFIDGWVRSGGLSNVIFFFVFLEKVYIFAHYLSLCCNFWL